MVQKRRMHWRRGKTGRFHNLRGRGNGDGGQNRISAFSSYCNNFRRHLEFLLQETARSPTVASQEKGLQHPAFCPAGVGSHGQGCPTCVSVETCFRVPCSVRHMIFLSLCPLVSSVVALSLPVSLGSSACFLYRCLHPQASVGSRGAGLTLPPPASLRPQALPLLPGGTSPPAAAPGYPLTSSIGVWPAAARPPASHHLLPPRPSTSRSLPSTVTGSARP